MQQSKREWNKEFGTQKVIKKRNGVFAEKTPTKPTIHSKNQSHYQAIRQQGKDDTNENYEYRQNAKYDQTTSLKDNKRISRSSILEKKVQERAMPTTSALSGSQYNIK